MIEIVVTQAVVVALQQAQAAPELSHGAVNPIHIDEVELIGVVGVQHCGIRRAPVWVVDPGTPRAQLHGGTQRRGVTQGQLHDVVVAIQKLVLRVLMPHRETLQRQR